MRSVLIVGGHSLIGYALYEAFKALSTQVFITSRQGSPASIKLDLSQSIDVSALPRCEIVYLCAAITRFAACEKTPGLAHRVNVAAQLELARHFLSIGSRVVFLSSNAVFDGFVESPNEDASLSPTSLYGQLKAEVEERLERVSQQYQGNISIVRLTKVVSQRLPLIAEWLSNLQAGKIISAFSDARLSPISLDYAVKGLVSCGAKNIQGKFHLSGESELTYYAFARALARSVRADQQLVWQEIADQLPKHNRLGMLRTEWALGIKAQDLNSLLADITKPPYAYP